MLELLQENRLMEAFDGVAYRLVAVKICWDVKKYCFRFLLQTRQRGYSFKRIQILLSKKVIELGSGILCAS